MSSSSSSKKAVHNEAVLLLGPNGLRPHTLNAEIYGRLSAPSEMLASVEENGILTPITVTKDHRIISGHQRWNAALRLNLPQVPVIVRSDLKSEEEISAALVESNIGRTKTTEERLKEFITLKSLESAQAKKRQATKSADLVQNFTHAEQGKARDIAAKKVGMSGVTADRGAAILQLAGKLKIEGKDKDAARLLEILNGQSINAADNFAKVKGLIPVPTKGRATPSPKPAPKAMETPDSLVKEAHALQHAVAEPKAPAQTVTPPSRSTSPVIKEYLSVPANDLEDERQDHDVVSVQELPCHHSKGRHLAQALVLLEKINAALLQQDEVPETQQPEWKEQAEYFFRTLAALGVALDI